MTVESALKLGKHLRKHNISWSRFCTLAFLRETTSSPVKTHTIGHFFELTLASTTGIVDRLEKDGLVTRKHSETDRRVILISITPAGKKLVEQALA